MRYQTLKALSTGLADGNFSSVELTLEIIKQIKTLDPKLNSFITISEEHALKQAKAADKLRSEGRAKPLTGIPIAQKDIFCTQGIKTSCGSKMLDNFISPYDATLVKRMNDEGIVMPGKTNMDEFAMGSSNETSWYGPCKNPWDLERVPGGSSGGSAAAVAGGLVPAATGTDTGGSIRQPAALCNLTGLKPTYGRVSRFGMIAFASSLDQAGTLTYTAEDAAMMLNVMAGFDPLDSTSQNREVPDYTATLNDSIKGLKIGLPAQFWDPNLDEDIKKPIEEAAKILEGLGAHLQTIQLPNVNLSIPAYYIIAPAECSSNLARFDGVRYGYRAENPKSLEDLYVRSRTEGFGQEVKRRILIGTYALSSGYYDAYYLKAQKIRHLIRQDFNEAFKKVDIILSPTSPCVAFRCNEKTNDPLSMYLSDTYTIAVNLAGLPALSAPAGFVGHLPLGMQLIGNHFTEGRLLNIAHLYQQATDWHTRQPENFK